MKYLYSVIGILDDKVVYDTKEVIGAPKSYYRTKKHMLKISHGGRDVHLIMTRLAEIEEVVTPVA